MFKKGDKVICINAINRTLLDHNGLYTISSSHGDLVCLEEMGYATYFTFRFVSAEIFIKQQEFEKKLKTILEE